MIFEHSKKASLVKRLKAAANILIPLILSSMERIETISNAMELRGFGKEKKRTWYSGRNFSRMDIICMIGFTLLMLLSFLITYLNGSRYFNPFVWYYFDTIIKPDTLCPVLLLKLIILWDLICLNISSTGKNI